MLELYHNNISVCAQKVRIVLAEKNVPWTGHHLDLVRGEHLRPEFTKLNPRAVVPVIVHDGKVVIESTVIDEYLDDAFLDPPLKPSSPHERSQMRLWARVPDDGLHMACGSISFASVFAKQLAQGLGEEELEHRLNNMPDPARRERQRQIIKNGFKAPFVRDHVKLFAKTVGDMDTALAGRDWLAGNMFSLAEAALLPYLERMDRLGLSGMWDRYPRVAAWFERGKTRPSFKAISDFDPVDYDDRIKNKQNSWADVKEILAGAA